MNSREPSVSKSTKVLPTEEVPTQEELNDILSTFHESPEHYVKIHGRSYREFFPETDATVLINNLKGAHS